MSSTLCACCGQPFEPRPQVPGQAYCSSPGCQRARKRSQRNPDYWRNYRDARPEYEQHNRAQQRLRDLSGQDAGLAKMDVCGLPTGLYRIARHPAFPMENDTSWIVEITPVCLTCPCKMDVSRDDLIDTSAIRP